jgi:formylglycine-generating enzyme
MPVLSALPISISGGMRLLFVVPAFFYLPAATAQNADSVFLIVNRILPEFRYKQELKNCVLLRGGDFVAGQRSGADSISLGRPAKKFVLPFFLSKFEVRNKEYRKFVQFVRDSIAHTLLGHFINNGNNRQINWEIEIDWKDERLEPMFLSPEDRLFGRKELDIYKLVYRTSSQQIISIYPDTLVWIRDFAYSYNEPMTKRYFSHPAFGNYPVVGINQLQAMAYCDWKSQQWNNALHAIYELTYRFEVRLPTSDEWEYAAQADYPLSLSDSTQRKAYRTAMYNQRFENNGYKYNFGQYFDQGGFFIKSYGHDGFFYTAPGNTYKPGKNGFYNLLGNVAEWTSSTGGYHPVYNLAGENEELATFRKKFPNSPFKTMDEKEIDAYLKKYVIVKGGSWSTDELFYLEPGANQYFLPDSTSHSFLGFRIAVSIVRNSE